MRVGSLGSSPASMSSTRSSGQWSAMVLGRRTGHGACRIRRSVTWADASRILASTRTCEPMGFRGVWIAAARAALVLGFPALVAQGAGGDQMRAAGGGAYLVHRIPHWWRRSGMSGYPHLESSPANHCQIRHSQAHQVNHPMDVALTSLVAGSTSGPCRTRIIISASGWSRTSDPRAGTYR